MLQRLFALALIVSIPTITAAQEPDPFKGLKFRNVGPSAGGRVARVCGVPGDPFTYYAATAAGGVWKSSDAGFTWKPIFDDQPVSSIGSIAVAPSDPNVVYVGSGEANIRGNVATGNGIYRSTDAGKTWKHVWINVGQIGTMIVHPTNPDFAYAAVLGNPFGPNENRGVYRTKDGGTTWQKVLFRDENTGASDVCLDASNPRILFAGMWQARRKPWELTSGGPGSGLHISRDGGDTWKRLGPGGKDIGLPKGPWGKVCVSVAPSNGQRIYAMIEAEEGGLYRSDDGGDKWEKINDKRAIRQRAWYFSTFTVDPNNDDIVWFPQVPLLKSTNGGKTLQRVNGAHHGDHHDIWIDPKNSQRIINCNDGGVDISVNGGGTWFAPPLPISQPYHIAVDNSTPYRLGSCLQDIGAMAGPSNSLTGGISLSDWENIGGGEAGHVAFDPADPDIIYAGEYGGYISRFDRRTRQARNVGIYPYNPSGHGGEDLKVRFQWTAPIMISPHDPKTVYHAGNFLFRTHDGGAHWDKISPDLTRNDRTRQRWSGGPITGDNTGVEIYCTIFAIAESPKQKGVLWAGSDDGLVHVSSDDGKNWTNVTANIPDMPDWGTVRCIECSPTDAGTAYLVAEAHRMNDFHPYVWKTTDFGKTWASLSSNIPADEYVHAVRMDPKKKSMLYAGTERGVRVSYDDGKNWRRLKINLPTVAVHDLVVKNDDLVIATMGRSAWILDDLTPVREWQPEVKNELKLFPPLKAVRWRTYDVPAADFDRSRADNPPFGAAFVYNLPKKAKEVTVEVLDKTGKTVAKIKSKKDEGEKEDDEEVGDYAEKEKDKKLLPIEAGLHQAAWDLRYEGVKKMHGVVVDAGDPEAGPLALPGEYTLKLTADGKSVTAKVTVVPDPRLHPAALVVSDSFVKGLPGFVVHAFKFDELSEQHVFALRVRDDIDLLTRTVKHLRTIHKQLEERQSLLKDEKSAKAFVESAKKLAKKLDELEEKLHNPKAKIVYDILALRGGAKLLSQLTSLYDAAIGSDGAPTQGMRELYPELHKELKGLTDDWQALLKGDVAKFNEQAKKLDLPGVWVPKDDGAKKK